jgi:hypothetical protein
MLQAHNYKVVILFYRVSEQILRNRITKRAENLYAAGKAYRSFPLNTLASVINDLEKNLTNFVIPLVESGVIHKIVYL